jgi:hypothetical protein
MLPTPNHYQSVFCFLLSHLKNIRRGGVTILRQTLAPSLKKRVK